MRDLEIRGAGSILGHRAERSHRRGRVRSLLPAPETGRRATERRKAPATARGRGAAGFRRHQRRRISRRRPGKARARIHSRRLHQRRRAPDPGLPQSGRNHDQPSNCNGSGASGATASENGPPAVDNLLLLSEIKLSAARARVSRVEVREGKLMLSRRGDFILVGGKFPRLTSGRIDLNLPEVWQWLKQL